MEAFAESAGTATLLGTPPERRVAAIEGEALMSESMPVVAQKGSYKIDVEAGKSYWWCACGKSGKQPFCDGSHKGRSSPAQGRALAATQQGQLSRRPVVGNPLPSAVPKQAPLPTRESRADASADRAPAQAGGMSGSAAACCGSAISSASPSGSAPFISVSAGVIGRGLPWACPSPFAFMMRK